MLANCRNYAGAYTPLSDGGRGNKKASFNDTSPWRRTGMEMHK